MMNLRPSSLLRHIFKNGGSRAGRSRARQRGVSSLSTTPRDRSGLSRCSLFMDANGQSDKRQRVHCTVANGTTRPLSVARPCTVSGFVYLDHHLQVPLDHDNPDGQTITIFAREVCCLDAAHVHTLQHLPYPGSKLRLVLKVTAIDKYPNAALPLLCYFQGGPGFQSPAPSDSLCWLNSATKSFRVVLLDQRGTGKSTPVRMSTLNAVGDDDQAQAKYCSFFRADSIVKDAELLRRHLTPDNMPWSILGQSFGGFCCVEYLSKFPEGMFCELYCGNVVLWVAHFLHFVLWVVHFLQRSV